MRLLLDLGYHHRGVLIIQRDNMAAPALLRDRKLKSLSNHIDNISWALKQWTMAGYLKVPHVKNAEN